MELVNVIFQIGLVIGVGFTSLQLIRKDEWWIRVSDFPHIQTTFITFVFFIGTIATLEWSGWYDWFIFLLGLITLIYQGVIIFPYTSMASKQSKDWGGKNGDRISILECNVFQDNTSYDQLITHVNNHNPNIVIALETDQKWVDGLSLLEANYPFLIKYPRDNTYGMLLYSNLEIVEHSIEFLVDPQIPSIDATIKLKDGKRIKLYVVHPEPPSPTENDRSTERDAELIVIGRKVKKEVLPVIVAGDLNDVAWSHTTRLFQRLSGLLDPRIGRGFFNTFNAKYKLLRWPLDHVFHSNHFLLDRMQRLTSVGSDHFPMLIELILDPPKGKKINGQTDDFSEEDKEETKEKLEKVKTI